MLNGPWLIQESYVYENPDLFMRLMKVAGAEAESFDKKGNAVMELMYNPLYKVSPYSDLSTLPSGTIVMVDIIGPTMKYGYWYYGSMDYAGLIERISQQDNISAIIFNMDGPGGQAAGTQHLADTIRNCGKKTVAFINDGMAASAMMWLASACDSIYCSHDTCEVGSVGVFVQFQDWIAYLEKAGIPTHTIYAPESKEKNLDYREALEGRYKLMQADLSVLAQTFIAAIRENRGNRLTSDEWIKGGMYRAQKALEMGLIDGVRNLAEIVEELEDSASDNSTTTSTKKTQKNNNNMSKFKDVAVLAGAAAASITPAQLDSANAELHAAGIEARMTTADVPAMTQQLADATAKITDLSAQVATMEANATAATEQINKLNAAIAATVVANAADDAEGAGALDEHGKAAAQFFGTNPTGKQDAAQAQAAATVDLDALDHNKEADSLLLA